MSPFALFTFVAALSSLVAVNGAVVQRDGTFTFITPQPTSPFQGAPSTTTTTSTLMTTSTASPTTTTSPSISTATPPMSSTTPYSTSTSSSSTLVVTSPTTSTTPCPTTPTSSTTPCTTSCVPVVTPCTRCSSSVTTTSSAPLTSAPSAHGANCDGVQNWQASFAYTAGNQVIFNNQLFTAKQWTFNNEPPTHPDQWTASGTCAQPINNKANCVGVAAWQSSVVYTAGNKVTFDNHLWSAVQWTQSNSPGDTSGSWKDLGVCA